MPKRISTRPSDINQAAFQMVQRSTAEPEPEQPTKKPHRATKAEISRVMSAMGRKGGRIGGKRSLETMTAEERRERASQAAKAKWAKNKGNQNGTVAL
jgi:hypothetical protein